MELCRKGRQTSGFRGQGPRLWKRGRDCKIRQRLKGDHEDGSSGFSLERVRSYRREERCRPVFRICRQCAEGTLEPVKILENQILLEFISTFSLVMTTYCRLP